MNNLNLRVIHLKMQKIVIQKIIIIHFNKKIFQYKKYTFYLI